MQHVSGREATIVPVPDRPQAMGATTHPLDIEEVRLSRPAAMVK